MSVSRRPTSPTADAPDAAAFASAGRVALVPSGVLALITVFASDFRFYGASKSVGALAALGLLVLAAWGAVAPRRTADAGAMFVCGALAGAIFPFAFEVFAVLPGLTWLALVVTAAATGAGLSQGPAIVDQRASEISRALRQRMGSRSGIDSEGRPDDGDAESRPVAGWYAQEDGTLRWWDGRAWTGDNHVEEVKPT